MITSSNLPPLSGDTDVYLEIPEDHRMLMPDTIWAKIGDDNQLEVLRWDIITAYAAQYDADKNRRDQTHVICKLLVLVREQALKEARDE